jgi:hypothetical protein
MTRPFGKALAKLDRQVVGGHRLVGVSRGGRKLYRVTPAVRQVGG